MPSCRKAPAGASSNAIPARAWLGFRVRVRVGVRVRVRVTCAGVVRPECEGEVGEDRLEDVEAHDRVEHVAQRAYLVRVRIRVRVRVRVC